MKHDFSIPFMKHSYWRKEHSPKPRTKFDAIDNFHDYVYFHSTIKFLHDINVTKMYNSFCPHKGYYIKPIPLYIIHLYNNSIIK